MKKPNAKAGKTVGRKLAEKFTGYHSRIWGVGGRCIPATEPHGFGLGKQCAEDTLEKLFDSAITKAAREAAWDGWEMHARYMTGFDSTVTHAQMVKKYGKWPVRRSG